MQEVVAHYTGSVEFRKIDWVQVWHPQSFWLAQATAAVELVQGPDAWNTFTSHLYQHQSEYVDDRVADASPRQFYVMMAKEAHAVTGIQESDFMHQITSGAATAAIKVHTRYGRQNGLHSSPTFLLNGLVHPAASSSWTLQEWKQVIDPLL